MLSQLQRHPTLYDIQTPSSQEAVRLAQELGIDKEKILSIIDNAVIESVRFLAGNDEISWQEYLEIYGKCRYFTHHIHLVQMKSQPMEDPI